MIITQPMVKEPQSMATIRFQDCDPFGHLNNANYIDYFFNAREDHLAQVYDFHLFEWTKTHNAGWVVAKNEIAYLRPGLVMEEVLIKTCLIALTESKIVVEGMMFEKDKKHLKSVLWSEFTYISFTTGRTGKHPDDLQEFLRSIELANSFWEDGFTQRVQALKQLSRGAI